MKKFLNLFVRFILILIFLFFLFLLYSRLREYRPEEVADVAINEQPSILTDSATYSALIWNIGYSGLGANMDFFYDGGEKVRDTREGVVHNLQEISGFIKRHDSIDFIMLQEVDLKSKRSYRINQLDTLHKALPGFSSYVGINYQVDFVPVPPINPLGKVKSGIVSFSRLSPESVKRYSFGGDYSLPTRLFMLKRCYLVSRYQLSNGKQLLIINTHNSAYDDGSLRKAQLDQLAKFVSGEYSKGNYVLIGGDWNQSPTAFEPRFGHVFDTVNLSYIPQDFLPDWQQVYQDSIPTNRRIITPYNAGTTPTTVIDFFIASPNIAINQTQTFDLNFVNSDHQPVLISFRLN